MKAWKFKFQNTNEEFHSFISIPLRWKKAYLWTYVGIDSHGGLCWYIKISILWAKLISSASRFTPEIVFKLTLYHMDTKSITKIKTTPWKFHRQNLQLPQETLEGKIWTSLPHSLDVGFQQDFCIWNRLFNSFLMLWNLT